MIGTELGGRYEILEEIGMGGMAYVYKAHCNVLNRLVAVKVLRKELEGGEEFVNRFKAEAQAAACLTHPNIVSIFDVGEQDGFYYIVMEYIEGTTLKEYIKQKGKLSPKESTYIAAQICGALSAAHEKNIIHRDIKPHNIMITSNNLVKVTDFGIARASNSATMRVGDSILGSVHYISPEQARGGYVDCRSDIYSLGIVLYEMLTGKLPFESESLIAVAMKHLEETPVSPSVLNPDVLPELEEIVLKAMAKETRNRYQTVDALKSELDNITFDSAASVEHEETNADDGTIVYVPKKAHITDEEENTGDAPEDGFSEDEVYDTQAEDVEEDYEYEEKGRITLNMVIAAVLISLIVVGGGFFTALYFVNPDAPIFMFFKNSDVDVPDFCNMDFGKAEKLASRHGLILEVGDKVPGPEDEDVVVYQSVDEGNSVKKGTHITVHLSMGPENVDTASYKGISAEVIDDFIEKGYKVDIKYKASTEIEEDKIISVKQVGEKFVFTVSIGSSELDCVVPNVLRMSLDKARVALEDKGLILNENVTYIESNTVEEGLIVEQSVDPGDKVPVKTKISVILASGKSDDKDDEGKKPSEDEGNSTQTPEMQSRTFHYSTEKLTGPTKVKIVEKSAENGTKTIFDQNVDPSTLDEIVVKVKGTKINEYTVYHDGAEILTTTINFEK